MARAGNAASTAGTVLVLVFMAAALAPAPSYAIRNVPEDVLLAEELPGAGGSTMLAFVASESPVPAGAPCSLNAEFIEFAIPVVADAPSPSPSAGVDGFHSDSQRAADVILPLSYVV